MISLIDSTGSIVEIVNANEFGSTMDLKSPETDEIILEISFTSKLVANAPKFTGEYGDTKKGLLLFDAKLSLPFF